MNTKTTKLRKQTSTCQELCAELTCLQGQMTWVHKRLLRSIIRWNLTILLYHYFWYITWVRWSLLIVLPMALFNFTLTFYFYFTLRKKIQTVKTKLA